MKSSAFRAALVAGALILVAVTGVIVARLTPRPSKSSAPRVTPKPAATEATEPSTLTLELGPEWRVVRQNALNDDSGRILAGTRATQETLVQAEGAHTELMLTELAITDADELALFLKGSPIVKTAVMKTTVAGRAGYLVPMGSVTGNTAFALVGSSTVLLIEFGDDRYGNLLPWPETVPAEVAAVIQNARVN